MAEEYNKTPYLLRQSGDGQLTKYNTREIDKIIGGTVAWNQLVQNGNFADTSGWFGGTSASISVSNNILTTSALGTNAQVFQGTSNGIVKGHKVFVRCGIRASASKRVLLRLSQDNPISNHHIIGYDLSANTHTVMQAVFNTTVDLPNVRFSVLVQDSANGETYQLDNFMSTDLTQAFGTAIADYVYSLEQTTEGSGIAWLKSHGFLTKDYYAYNTGSLLSVKTSAHVMRDGNDTVIATYPLDSDLELRGIPKLSSGSLYYDGDVYESSGNVTRKYGIVDLGTLNYTYQSYNSRFVSSTQVSNAKPNGDDYTVANMVCSQFLPVIPPNASGNYKGEGISFGTSDTLLRIQTNRWTDAQSFKTAMSGVYLVYELATPTTEQADPYGNPQLVSPLGTEEYVDTRDVPVPVGHETFYPVDAGYGDTLISDLPAFGSTIGPNDYLVLDNGKETMKVSAIELVTQIVNSMNS